MAMPEPLVGSGIVTALTVVVSIAALFLCLLLGVGVCLRLMSSPQPRPPLSRPT